MQSQATSVFSAINSRNIELAMQLLGQGTIDIRATDSNGYTALTLAARKGHKDVVELLLAMGADIHARENGDTALLQAAYNGHKDIVALLLDRGADICARDNNRDTALTLAALSGYKDVVQLLLDRGADIHTRNDDGDTALTLAAFLNRTDAVELLLNRGADIHTRNDDNNTALIRAASFGSRDTVKLLLDRGANINARNEDNDTALIRAASFGSRDTVKLLLDRGANINARNEDNDTALTLAAKRGRKNVVELLRLFGSFESRVAKLEDAGIEVSIPAYFICPISHSIMNDPVTVSSGITYDRLSLEEYFAAKNNPTSLPCPTTQEHRIAKTELKNGTAVIVKNLINDFLEKIEKESKLGKEGSAIIPVCLFVNHQNETRQSKALTPAKRGTSN
jgi:ankyrin repeat protein